MIRRKPAAGALPGIEAVDAYNAQVRGLPTNVTALAFGFRPKASFRSAEEIGAARPPAPARPA